MSDSEDYEKVGRTISSTVRTAVPLPPDLSPRDPKNDGSPYHYLRETDEHLFRYMLEETIRIAEKTKDLHAEEIQPSPASGDEAVSIHNIHEDATRILKRSREKIAEATAALDKLDYDAQHPDERPTFGACEETDQPIGYYRLLTEPAARLSVEAKEELENVQARTRDREAPYRSNRIGGFSF